MRVAGQGLVQRCCGAEEQRRGRRQLLCRGTEGPDRSGELRQCRRGRAYGCGELRARRDRLERAAGLVDELPEVVVASCGRRQDAIAAAGEVGQGAPL